MTRDTASRSQLVWLVVVALASPRALLLSEDGRAAYSPGMTASMVFLGFGKYARADKIYALEPITGDERGGGRRTRVWVEGLAEPLVASRTERTILHDMGHEAGDSVLLDGALDLAERLAAAAEEGRVDLGDLGRRARKAARRDRAAERDRAALLTRASTASSSATSLEVARELVGWTLLMDGVGGVIVETEAYAPDDPASHSLPRATPRNATMFGPAGRALRLPLVRDPLVRERRLRRGGRRRGRAPAGARADAGLDAMRDRRGLDDPRLLCSGPGRLTQALGISGEHDGLAARPAAVRAGAARCEGRRRRVARASGSRVPSSQPVALLARRVYVREPSPTTSLTRSPGRPRRPGSGDCWRTVPVRARARSAPAAAASAAPPRAARREARADEVREQRRSAPSTPRSSRRRSPRARPRADPGSTTSPGSVPAFAGAYTTFAASGCCGEPRLRAARRSCRRRAGPSTSFGLQSAFSSGPSPEKYDDEPCAAAVAVVVLPLAVALRPPTSRRRPDTGASRTTASVGLVDLLHELLPDQRRKRPAGDRLAPELREHRAEARPDSRPRRRRRARACSRRTTRRRSCPSSPSCRRPAGRESRRAGPSRADDVLEDVW